MGLVVAQLGCHWDNTESEQCQKRQPTGASYGKASEGIVHLGPIMLFIQHKTPLFLTKTEIPPALVI